MIVSISSSLFQDGSRVSRYINDGVLLKHLFDDATTLYEVREGKGGGEGVVFLVFDVLQMRYLGVEGVAPTVPSS